VRFTFDLAVAGTSKVKKAKAVRVSVANGSTRFIQPDAVSASNDGLGYCAVVTSGGVDCWGDNSVGELGDGGSGLLCGNGPEACSKTPVAVENLSGVASLASDSSSFCAVLTSGGVDCWGDNYYGELGNGSTSGPQICGSGSLTAPCSTTPVAVTGLTGVASLVSEADGAPNGYGYCAVLISGGVDCWGENYAGQLGDGTTTASSVPVAVTGLTGVAALTSDGDGRGDLQGYCAVLTSGGVDCWGDNSVGELGDGTTSGPDSCGGTACSTAPVSVTGITDATSIVSNAEGYCAVLTSGGADCWGENGAGQVGNGTTSDESVPAPVLGLTGASGLASDGDGACALLTSGDVDCWGDNSVGELGDGATSGPDSCNGSACSTTPVAAVGLTSVASLGSDGSGYCAVLTTGAVDCWGYNGSGYLGQGTLTGPDSCNGVACGATPVPVAGLTPVATVTSDGHGYCVIATTGVMDCWGDDSEGQLGNNTTYDSYGPVRVS
jgi:alpha-tubulin suppressor-like RCC1 family protein